MSSLQYTPMLPFLQHREKNPICLDDHAGDERSDHEHGYRDINYIYDENRYEKQEFCTLNVLVVRGVSGQKGAVERVGVGHVHVNVFREIGGWAGNGCSCMKGDIGTR